jgi:hypothetical protein
MQALATSPVGGSGLKILFDLFGQERCRALISGTGSKAKRPEAEGLWSVTDTVTYYTRGTEDTLRLSTDISQSDIYIVMF